MNRDSGGRRRSIEDIGPRYAMCVGASGVSCLVRAGFGWPVCGEGPEPYFSALILSQRLFRSHSFGASESGMNRDSGGRRRSIEDIGPRYVG